MRVDVVDAQDVPTDLRRIMTCVRIGVPLRLRKRGRHTYLIDFPGDRPLGLDGSDVRVPEPCTGS